MSLKIQLNDDQKKQWDELMKGIKRGEDLLAKEPGAHAMSEHLQTLISYSSYTPRLVEIANAVYGWAKGQTAIEAMEDPRVLSLGQNLQRKWIEGKLAAYEAIFQKTERLKKSLDSAIDGYRSLLSYEKEQMKNTNG